MAQPIVGRRYRRRVLVNRLMLVLTVLATLISLIPLVLIILYVAKQGIGSLSIDFLTNTFRPISFGTTSSGGGVLHAIVGTVIIVGFSLLLAAPIGIMAGIYLAEYPGNSASTAIRFCVDVLSAMPSIVVGVTAYVLIVQQVKSFSGFAGSIALVVLMVPIITRTTEEILRLVPQSSREAAIALGAPKWRTTLTIVLPMALSGIATGVLLAFARAAGETAPLLVTVLGNNNLTYDLFGPMQALPLLAYRYTEQPYKVLNQQAWGAAFLLVVIVLGINILVRIFTRTRSPR
ncbi:MAG TPA: phosphate ABC transporter permease PstA [Nitrolancea sp.]|jgi:phosphate transport system permease protein|nr:phosphate ABC transporter permease PstA [Nitrolancea sp.]